MIGQVVEGLQCAVELVNREDEALRDMLLVGAVTGLCANGRFYDDAMDKRATTGVFVSESIANCALEVVDLVMIARRKK